MTRKITISKKELIKLLEPYDNEKLIVFKVKLQEGNVGFYDLKKDDKRSDSDKLVLTSETLDKWYDEDIKELLQKTKEYEIFKKIVFGLIDEKQKIAKKKMDEESDYDVPSATVMEYYYSGMLDACVQLQHELEKRDIKVWM